MGKQNKESEIRLKFVIVCLVLIIALMIGSDCKAGLFLDLDLGAHASSWPETSCTKDTYKITRMPGGSVTGTCVEQSQYLGNEAPVGSFKIGYQSPAYGIGWLKIRGHGYYQHISSIADNRDTGVDLVMIGMRLEL